MQVAEIILIGGGGHCRSCIDVIEHEGRFRIRGIVEAPQARTEEVLGYPVIGTDDQLPRLRREIPRALVTVGQIRTPRIRIALFNELKRLDFEMPSIVSPTALVSPHATVGAGTVVMHHAIVNAGARVGENTILNTRSLVEHDAVIGSHCHISTGAIVNGAATVDDRCFVGSHATVVQMAHLPADSFLKANALLK